MGKRAKKDKNNQGKMLNFIQQVFMSNIVHQITQNREMSNQKTNAIVQYILGFLRQKGGWMVESQVSGLTLEYHAPINEFEKKKLTILFQERKSSYKFTLLTKIESKAVSAGAFNLLKLIENFNKNPLHDNSLYYFEKPSTFALRCSIEKDTLDQFQQKQAVDYFRNYFETINSDYVLCLSRISMMCYEEEYSSVGMKEVVEFVNLYKVSLGIDIKKRNEGAEGLTERKFKVVNFMGPNPIVKCQQQPNEQQFNRMNFYLRKFKSEKYQSSKDSTQVTKPLAHKIIMMKESVDKNWKAPESSYGSLQRVQAEYITISSFNDAAAELIEKQRKQIQPSECDKLSRNVLVRKNYKKKDKCPSCVHEINPKCECYVRLRSFETQIAIVSCIRNVMAQSIASYFLELNGQEQAKLAKLYSKFYPKCLSSQKIKANDVLPMIMHFLDALKIFDSLSILHRDLKPDNILIDSKKIPKIIDFGSAWILNRSILNQKDIDINNELYTTKKYNLYFDEAIFSERNKMTAKEFEQHPLFDMHAFGVIIREIFTGSQGSGELGSFVLMNLSWLSSKCTAHNPNMRLTPNEVDNFCSLLAKFWSLKSQSTSK